MAVAWVFICAGAPWRSSSDRSSAAHRARIGLPRCSARFPQCWSRDRPCARSEEHTSELQSHLNLVCRLLLEKKKRPPPIDDLAGVGFLQPRERIARNV